MNVCQSLARQMDLKLSLKCVVTNATSLPYLLTNYLFELKHLEKVSAEQDMKNNYEIANKIENRFKNRYNNVLPSESSTIMTGRI